MTQEQAMSHPYWMKFQQRLPVVINAMVQRGMINPNESGYLQRMLGNSYAEMHRLMESLNTRYSQINDGQMDNEIFNWLQPAIQTLRVRMNQMMASNGGGGWGCGGGGGGFRIGGGFDIGSVAAGIPRSPFGGGAPGGTPGGPFNPSSTNLFSAGAGGSDPSRAIFGGGSGQPSAKRQEQINEAMAPKKPDKPVTTPEWKVPEIIDPKDPVELGDVSLLVAKYSLSSGEIARRIIVRDPRVSYISDSEVLEKYKGIFSMYPDSNRKFITIMYKQLKLLPVGRDEFVKLASALGTAVARANNVESKLRAIISTCKNFSVGATEQFTKMFLDELDAHMQCGELCDSFHPKNILNRPNRIEDVLSWVTGDIDKGMLDALKGMEGFMERFDALLSVLIEYTVQNLSKIVINPSIDKSILDDFSRILPGVWSSDCGETLRGSDDLINLFIATREVIDGSKTANAQQKESVLKTTLNDLSKNFTLLFLPRVVSWCNYSKLDVCNYDEVGNCQPAVFPPKQPRNDVEFFVGEVLEKLAMSKDTIAKWAPKNLYMEIHEETYCLQYGKTTNNCGWIACSKYWC